MNEIIKLKFGSHVYGTSLPTSDTDFKAIYIPSSDDILLQKVKRTININTKTSPEAKNSADDVDMEIFSLQQYLHLLMEGQTVALDMLFTPKSFHLLPENETWEYIFSNRKEFLHSGISSFVGYARQQASKYGIKGSRMHSLKLVLDLLSQANPYSKLGTLDLQGVLNNEYVSIVNIKGPNGQLEPHLEVVNRKMGFHVKVKHALEVFQKIYDQYGERAKQAEKNEGVDWKALMHAVRVNAEAVELLTTHHITFPRPEAQDLLNIRQGNIKYKEVAEIIERGLASLEQAQIISTLPKFPNKDFAESIVKDVYGKQIYF